jgi:cell division protein FtsA
MKNQAELLKVKFGSALAVENKETDIVVIPGLKGREPKEISIRNLAHIIEARMTEILEHVHYEIKNSGFEKQLIGGIVITGGGAQLKHMKQLVEYVTGMSCRVGYPNEHVSKAPSEDMLMPTLSTGVGLVINGLEKGSKYEGKVIEAEITDTVEPEIEEQIEPKAPEKGPRPKDRGIGFLQRFKEFFETEEE